MNDPTNCPSAISMVVGNGELHFYSDPIEGDEKARILGGMHFRLAAEQDYRPQAREVYQSHRMIDDTRPDRHRPLEVQTLANVISDVDQLLAAAGVWTNGSIRRGVTNLVDERDKLRERTSDLAAKNTHQARRLQDWSASYQQLEQMHRVLDEAYQALCQQHADAVAHLQHTSETPPQGRAFVEGFQPAAPVVPETGPLCQCAAFPMAGGASDCPNHVETGPETRPSATLPQDLQGLEPVSPTAVGYAPGRALAVPDTYQRET